MFNWAAYELDLEQRNPFARLIIREEGRHALRDRLRDAEVPLEAIDQIGDWSSVGGAGSKYGRGYAISKLAKYLSSISVELSPAPQD